MRISKSRSNAMAIPVPAVILQGAMLFIVLFGWAAMVHAQEKATLPAPAGTETVPATQLAPGTETSSPGAAPERTLKPMETAAEAKMSGGNIGRIETVSRYLVRGPAR